MKLLLVEDEPGISIYLRNLMAPYADTIITVQTLTECHEVLSREKFDAILLDLKLKDAAPSMTVGDIPKIRAAQPQAALIVNTVMGNDYIESAKAAGADFVISKEPDGLERKAFCAAIYTALQAKGTRADLAANMEMLRKVAES